MTKVNNILNLLVPVHLDALVINENQEKQLWKDTSLKLENLSNYKRYGALGYYLEANATDSAQSINSDILGTGVHLHWVLPDGLRKGIHKPTGELILPAAPNRWLVVRINALRQVKAWVVESDRLADDQETRFNWIQEDAATGTLKAVNIGRIVSLEDYNAAGESDVKLTVVAPGNPDFAASYMSCKNVFGFYDEMTDNDGKPLKNGMLVTYQVYGWYSDGGENPFRGLSGGEVTAKIKELSWAVKGDNAFIDGVGTDIICHAMVSNVEWKPKPVTRVPSGEILIGIGNSTSEALASLLQSKTKAIETLIPGKLLGAFQYKSILDNGIEGNGLALLEKQVHARGFAPVDGGTYWAIEPKERKPGDNAADISDRAYPQNIADQLVALNDLQKQYDKGVNKLKSLQAKLYALKYKLVFLDTTENGLTKAARDKQRVDLTKEAGEIREQVKSLVGEVSGLRSATDEATDTSWPNGYNGAIAGLYRDLLIAISKSAIKGYKLKNVPMPKFFEPADPAIVLLGLDPSEKYFKKGVTGLRAGKDDKPATDILNCRLAGQLPTKIAIPPHKSDVTQSVTSQEVVANTTNIFLGQLDGRLPRDIRALFYESFLLNPLMAEAISDFITEDIAWISESIRDFNKNPTAYTFRADDRDLQAILPPNFAAVVWQQPWNPLYLEWSADWTSSYETLTPKVLANWKFGDEQSKVDFRYEPMPKSVVPAPVEYSGRTLLSLQMANKIQDLNDKIKKHFGAELFWNDVPMAQTLGGFGAQLIQREQGVQMPVMNNKLEIDDDYRWIGDENTWRPMVNGMPFSPVRSGQLKITMLRVIDSFGQVKENFMKDEGRRGHKGHKPWVMANSAGMPGAEKKTYTYILAPRIVQPARLKFDWISAKNPTNATDSNPATTPVCGWLLYNKMDDNISVFTAAGDEIGRLIKTKKKDVVPKPVTGDQNSHANVAPVEIVLETLTGTPAVYANNTLEQTVAFIKQSEVNFEEMKTQIKKVTDRIQAKYSRQQLTMALPTGFPMAVATAEFGVFLKEQPAEDQSWAPAGPGKFEDIEYNPTFGNAANKTDGLVGYFLNNDYTSFGGPNGETGAAPRFFSKPKVTFKTSKTMPVTLLLDPRTAVSLSTGILPIGVYDLPQHTIARALKSISLRILAAPVLTPVSKLKVPLLQSNDITWEFINPHPKKDLLNAEQGAGNLRFEATRAVEGWLKMKTEAADDKP